MKRTINKKTIFMLGGTLLTILIILSLIIFNSYNSQKNYEQALLLFEKNNYTQAVKIFDSLKNYKDSVNYSDKCRIAIGDSFLELEDFDKAKKEYEKIHDAAQQSEMLNKCKYAKAIKLFNEKKYVESKSIFEKLGKFQDSSDYLNKCRMEIKFSKFDYTGTNDTYNNFYNCYGKVSDATDIDSAESYFSFAYGTWYDESDTKIEISPTLFNGKEYGVNAVSNNAALIYFFDDETTIYELYSYHDRIAGYMLNYSKMGDSENTKIYCSMTSSEYENAYQKWEEEQAKIPAYSDNALINRTAERVKERLSKNYSAKERLYQSFKINNSSVTYDWTTRTYTCYLSVTYSTYIFDIWGTSENSYDVTATFQDIGSELVATGLSIY